MIDATKVCRALTWVVVGAGLLDEAPEFFKLNKDEIDALHEMYLKIMSITNKGESL